MFETEGKGEDFEGSVGAEFNYGAAPDVRASLAFYRGKIKVLETPTVERVTLDAPERKAALFRLEVPADAFKPGLYTCQVNVIDGAAGKFAFPRVAMLVR